MDANTTAALFQTVLPLVMIFGLMYLMIILPQRRRDKKTREMLNALQVGNNIVTIGGIMGKIVNIKDDEITIETSIKTQVKVKKWAIKEVDKLIEA